MSEVDGARSEVATFAGGADPPPVGWPPPDGAPPEPLDEATNLVARARGALVAGPEVAGDVRLRRVKVAAARAATPVGDLVGRVAEDTLVATTVLIGELTTVRSRSEHLAAVVATVDASIDDVGTEVGALRSEVAALRAELSELRAEVAGLGGLAPPVG